MLMGHTISDTPSLAAQAAMCGSLKRGAGVDPRKYYKPIYLVPPVQLSGQTYWEIAETDVVFCFSDQGFDRILAAHLLPGNPAEPQLAPEANTDDVLDQDLESYLESLPETRKDEFDDGLTDEDFDLDKRLLLPPAPARRIKVKLRFVGRQLPRLQIDPELEFDPELDEERDA